MTQQDTSTPGHNAKPRLPRLPHREGTWFAVPLLAGGYGVGVVTRMAPRARMVVAYLFNQRYDSLPPLEDMARHRPKAAIKRLQIGDSRLRSGQWPILGELPDWDRSDWPMPKFLRHDESTQRAWRTSYSDTDPSVLVREEPAVYADPAYERDALHGAGVIELLMSKLLHHSFLLSHIDG